MMKIFFEKELIERLDNTDIEDITDLIEKLDYEKLLEKIRDEKESIQNLIYKECFKDSDIDIMENNEIIISNSDFEIFQHNLSYDYEREKFIIIQLQTNESLHPDDIKLNIFEIRDIFNGDENLIKYNENEKVTIDLVKEDIKLCVDEYTFNLINEIDESVIYENIYKRLHHELKKIYKLIDFNIKDSAIYLQQYDENKFF